ncbi:putative centrosomal protein [Apostichopus japonicus]|uniref:Putative centrosomal protein n=1 Tax=Stichopus japonicus TaxID=307972 RepID=A0A2G8KHG6_STIJA|nr:putative centrosomal protein [Apostichopus japonicus]
MTLRMNDLSTPRSDPSSAVPYLLLDIRDQDDFEKCHIISAKNYPAAMLSRAVNNYTNDILNYRNKPGRLIVIYDEDERISTKAATTFAQRGFDNVFVLSGVTPLVSKVTVTPIASNVTVTPLASKCDSDTSSPKWDSDTSILQSNSDTSSLKWESDTPGLKCDSDISSLKCDSDTSSLKCDSDTSSLQVTVTPLVSNVAVTPLVLM